MKRKVVVFRSKLLPFSETFIKEQVLSYSKWEPVLMGHCLLKNRVNLDDITNKIVFDYNDSGVSCFKRKVYKFFNVCPIKDKKIIAQQRADLIHIHFGVDAVVNWSTFKQFKKPIVITLHGYDINIKKEWWASGNEGRHLKRYPERLLEISKYNNVYFIAVSKAIKERAIAFGIPPKKISVSYIGIDTFSFKNSMTPFNERRQILFVGRLVEKKGCEILINAYAKLHRQHYGYPLKIIGDGPLKHQLETYAKKLNLNVQFTGVLSKREIIAELNKTAIFCLPSIHASSGDAEGFGLVLLEAAACGVPVITSAFGGAEEGVIHGLTGFSFPEKDTNRLSYYLNLLLSDPNLMESMGKAGQQFVADNFDLKKCTEELEVIYNSIMEQFFEK
ncbi:TPA: glycosyltransferase [Escherichia coli]|uniref:Glycosyltransferase n=5 Tax=Escherichia coli TaxID=562 RepID=A0A146IG37_ECOLX|nr:glycosyltransferase [Escherichia coli]APK85864.1 hypothetical protein RG52_15290 [Escherichia coli]APL46759.1 hypothetical protein RG65_06480 [Escherichia coli]APL56066.1 hypothetical protein RG67_07890 [Escherichia coli]EES0942744.1 glycosyltransferase [Escherichia coli]EES2037918.1 glycosyltransferase [Escherichia coli]